MENFKKLPKMQHFKEGGSVKYETRKEHKEEVSADVAQDKKIIKKAFKMHDEQEHKGERTDLSKLKKGGRSKKSMGTVRKYKTGGSVENAYGAKKTDKDIKDIAASKRQKPALLCGGKSVKKYQEGRSVFSDIKDAIIGTPAQNAQASQDEAKYLRAQKLRQAAGAQMSPAEKMAMGLAGLGQQLQPAQSGLSQATAPAQKRGGKVKKACK